MTKKIIMSLACIAALVAAFQVTAEADSWDRRILRPGERIEVSGGVVVVNRNQYPVSIDGLSQIYVTPYNDWNPPGDTFSLRLYPVSGGALLSCDNISQGGRPGSQVAQCIDIGDGRNHSCVQVSPTTCQAREGSGNGGSAGCEAVCRSRSW